MRILRKVINIGLPLVGVMIVLSMLLALEAQLGHMVLVVLGLLLVEVGALNLTQQLLPSERTYLALRIEADQFLMLVRQINNAALAVKKDDTPENHQSFEEVRDAMRQTVDRIADVAGKTEAEIVAEQAAWPTQRDDAVRLM